MDLQGHVAVVTGAGQGIGAAIVKSLAEAGAATAAWDLDGERAEAMAEAIRQEHGTQSIGARVDVADRESVDRALDTARHELPPVDVLVNNAGIDDIGPFLQSKEETWDRIIAVNLKGTLVCSHAVLAGMVERGRGKIVNIASDAGKVGASGEAVYAATKGGVIAFTKTLARETAAHGINVNCVCPGPTDTALLDQLAEGNQKLYDSLVRAIPMRRIAQPADIAGAVVFLCSDAASYITGQALSVSGGLTMS